MKIHYVNAVLETLKEGGNIASVLSGLKAAMEEKGHVRLYASVLRSVLVKLEARDTSNLPHVTVANEQVLSEQKESITAALKEIGVTSDFEIVIDPSIIGGHIVLYNNVLLDNSYKTALTKLYRSITK
ncbi:F0F1 ATP synthase subunit delta [Candidatus Pacebacteria bacterium]|nr:F0F1 ATP synthase subunit delta [Candidatus Paceibacterota bacterium]